MIIQAARVVTMGRPGEHRRGEAMNQFTELPHADVRIHDGIVQRILAYQEGTPGITPEGDEEIIQGAGKTLMPGFVDCHTHACWIGSRLDEWEQTQRGASYLEILQAGGGILSTVRAVRAATQSELSEGLLARLGVMRRHGTTVAEVKSGYGLDTDSELKMLRAIHDASERWSGRVSPTACLGHALDPGVEPAEFVRRTIHETLPAVTTEFPGITIDAYCEQGAWSLDDCLRLFDAAAAAGHPIRVHADQFHPLGMVDAAVERHFASVDHLEATTPESLRRLAESSTFGVMLPACGFHLDERYANGRGLIDAGGGLAIATNFNPGSAPCPSMPMIMALACRKLGLTIAEALVAATINAAAILRIADAGVIVEGGPADLILLDTPDPRSLAFEFGSNRVTWIGL